MPQITEPYFVRDAAGNPIAAVVPMADYEILIDALEEINDLQAHDAAKADDPQGLPFDQAVADIARMTADRHERAA